MTTKSQSDSSLAQNSAEPTNSAATPSDNAACENSNQSASQSWAYSDIVKDHFLSPRNFLMGDETKYPHDAEGTVGNPVCGDQMKMFLQIEDDKIKDVKWKTYGCASAIASTSALSELAKGKTLDDALKIGPAEIAEFLGGLPAHKFHCSVLGHEALSAAIENYHKQQ